MKPKAAIAIARAIEELDGLVVRHPWARRARKIVPETPAALSTVWHDLEFGLSLRRDVIDSAMQALASLIKPRKAFWKSPSLSGRERVVLSAIVVRSGYALARFMMAVPGAPPADATQGASALARFAALLDDYDASIRRMCLDLTRVVAGDLPQPALALAEVPPGAHPAAVTPASPPQRPATSTPEPQVLAGVTGRARL